FARRIAALGGTGRPCSVVTPDGMPKLPESARTLYTPDPAIGTHAWRRRGVGARAYSICGVNHTISSDTAMDGIAGLLTGPVQPWDAVICTSRAAKAAMIRLLENHADYLSQRGGGRFRVQLKMPVIPLGVDCSQYLEGDAAEAVRNGVRRGLGIGADDFVALYLGRLSFHAKAHPMAMYTALEEAAQRSGKRLHLIQAGWFPNEGIEREFRDGARNFCPSVNAIFLDGRDPDVCRDVWCASDTFISLSDNIQETFGLTPIEAMAAGLPCVVSDWNGYRDTIRDGIDGFSIPTWLPLPGSGGDLTLPNDNLVGDAARDRNYNHYCGVVSQCTSVDVAKATEALTALVENPELRRRMGESGRARALRNFDWRVVVNAYQDLWRELGHVRSRADESAPPSDGRPLNPLRDDPFALFAGYSTATVDGEAVVELALPADRALARLEVLCAASMNDFAQPIMLSPEDVRKLLTLLAEHGVSDVFSLAEQFDEGLRFRVPRTIAWLAKLGIIGLSSGDGNLQPAVVKPENSETGRLVALGLSARGRGAMQAAVEYFEKALRTDPGDVDANIYMGEVLAGQGRLDAATAAFRRALNRTPGHLPAQRNLGKALFLKGDEQAGIEVMTAAVARAPEDADSRFLLGAAYRRVGEVNKAIRELEHCLQIDGKRGDAMFHLGLARKSLGREDDARSTFMRALDLDPRDVFAKSALLNLDMEDAGRRNVAGQASGRRIALHLSTRGEYPLLRPVFEALGEKHWPMMTCDGRELQEFGASVVVMAGSHAAALKKLLPDASIVNIGFGLASKNFLGRVSKPGDFLCAPSAAVAADIRERRGLAEDRVWATGYPSMDALFIEISSAVAAHVESPRRTVVYAPTDRHYLSSAQMLGGEVVELLTRGREDIDLILRPHPRHCEKPPSWLALWRELAAKHDHVTLIDDPAAAATPWLAHADVLVSDASSVMLEFLALDRPMVLLSNPDRFNDPTHFDAAGLEWAWRDMGEEVFDVELLSEAVNRALIGPDERSKIRKGYCGHLFGDMADGNAAHRIAARIAAIPDGKR
ncbi:MAG: glycosyltransferase, partial [Rhodospirillaceae bacterium]|nr:glycosyltransferase [Rhodospirillaceae bacterium]